MLTRIVSVSFGLTRVVVADRVVSRGIMVGKTARLLARCLLLPSGISRKPALAKRVSCIASYHACPAAVLVKVALLLAVCKIGISD